MAGIPMEKIVVPIDFSEDAFEAVDVALDIASQPSNVHVIHVLPELNVAEPGVVWRTIDNENRRKHATEAIREQLSDAKHADLQVLVEIGDPGHAVAEYAERIGADLIVAPSHGRTGIRRMLIGSVAERIVRLAHCPVLVLRK